MARLHLALPNLRGAPPAPRHRNQHARRPADLQGGLSRTIAGGEFRLSPRLPQLPSPPGHEPSPRTTMVRQSPEKRREQMKDAYRLPSERPPRLLHLPQASGSHSGTLLHAAPPPPPHSSAAGHHQQHQTYRTVDSYDRTGAGGLDDPHHMAYSSDHPLAHAGATMRMRPPQPQPPPQQQQQHHHHHHAGASPHGSPTRTGGGGTP